MQEPRECSSRPDESKECDRGAQRLRVPEGLGSVPSTRGGGKECPLGGGREKRCLSQFQRHNNQVTLSFIAY